MKVLLAGGAGYIGTHTAVQLLKGGYEVVVVDNYDNSCPEAVKRAEALAGGKVSLYEADIQGRDAVQAILAKEQPETVIHFAGLKAVGESVSQPLRYYHNNVTGTLNLLDIMGKYNAKRIVFSSSATLTSSR